MFLLILLVLMSLAGCQPLPLEGPEATLEQIALPKPVEPPVPPAPLAKPIPGPQAEAGSFRAWIPRDVSPNGDVVEGHWAIISLTPPAVEAAQPRKVVPRVPHRPPRQAGQAPQAQPALPKVPAATPVPTLPGNMPIDPNIVQRFRQQGGNSAPPILPGLP